MALLAMLIRARYPHEFPRKPYSPGLLTADDLACCADGVAQEIRRNTRAAEAAGFASEAAIIVLAR
ncbi:hypothetical protein, partial [Bradyrhizobium sp.]|uniref:hypothetical protein n=1 Tax=Bradyrhizobium sp. TaxID=376 RepID=UPI0025BE95DA